MNTATLDPSIAQFRLAMATPAPEDGCSYHRGLGPLGAMARQEPRFVPHGPLASRQGRGWDLGWNFTYACHGVFLQRPFLPVHVQFCKQCKALGLPLWIEWDDLLYDIPRSNPVYAGYSDQKSIHDNMKVMVELADVVTTATQPLAEVLGPKARVVPNAQHTKFYSEPRQRRVFWRGSATHDADVATVLPQLRDLANLPQFANWKWHFSGGIPYVIYDAIPERVYEESPGTGPVFFVPFMSLMAPWVCFVPLQNCFFNHCKSNLAWVEASTAGAVVLAPNWVEWRRPGIINYDNPKDFQEKLRATISEFKEGAFHPNVKLSREYITQNLTLPVVNRLRWEIINELYAISKAV